MDNNLAFVKGEQSRFCTYCGLSVPRFHDLVKCPLRNCGHSYIGPNPPKGFFLVFRMPRWISKRHAFMLCHGMTPLGINKNKLKAKHRQEMLKMEREVDQQLKELQKQADRVTFEKSLKTKTASLSTFATETTSDEEKELLKKIDNEDGNSDKDIMDTTESFSN